MKTMTIGIAVMMVPDETDECTAAAELGTSYEIGPVPSPTRTFITRSGKCVGVALNVRDLQLRRDGRPNVFSRKR